VASLGWVRSGSSEEQRLVPLRCNKERPGRLGATGAHPLRVHIARPQLNVVVMLTQTPGHTFMAGFFFALAISAAIDRVSLVICRRPVSV
jgi:hypothetical protein